MEILAVPLENFFKEWSTYKIFVERGEEPLRKTEHVHL